MLWVMMRAVHANEVRKFKAMRVESCEMTKDDDHRGRRYGWVLRGSRSLRYVFTIRCTACQSMGLSGLHYSIVQ